MRQAAPVVALALFSLLAACAPAGPASPSATSPGTTGTAEDRRTLTIAVRAEPATLTFKPLQTAGQLTMEGARGLFNAHLVSFDSKGAARPQLAEALPTLGTDSWRVFPDGTMETTYRLRPGLTWHDGAPLTSADLAFALRVYTGPVAGEASLPPHGLMEEIVAADERTVVIRWRKPYPEAGVLGTTFPTLPRHILESAYDPSPGGPEAFVGHPFWTSQYVGLGPFALHRWEAGAFLEGAAFANYVFGRPKIARVRLSFISDPNTVLANLLSGGVLLTFDDAIRFQQGAILQRQWSDGAIVLFPLHVRYTEIQLRPELVSPPALLDVRVRRAMAHLIDKQSLLDGLLDGIGLEANTIISPGVDYFDALDRAVLKYPHDPRRAEQLLTEAGLARRGEGFYAAAAGERFTPELRVRASAHNEAEMAIVVDGWRRSGIDATSYVIPAAQSQDRTVLAVFPGLATTSRPAREEQLSNLTTSAIPTAETRWTGSNRAGWSNAEYDRLAEAFSSTLDRAERNRQVIQMMRLFSEDLPGLFLYYNVSVAAHASTLRGPRPVTPETQITWDVHEWSWAP